MQWSYLTPKARVTSLPMRGAACVAMTPIHAGETTAAFGGWVATGAELAARDPSQATLALQIDDDLFLVSPTRSAGDCVNHSCEPNCGLAGGVLLVAMRDIAAGEEITFDYSMADSSSYDEFDCYCGHHSCRGRVTATDWAISDLQARYRGFFSPYLQRRIDGAPLSLSASFHKGPFH